jgi:hypothetical protein
MFVCSAVTDRNIQGLECTLRRTGYCAVGFLLDITFGFLGPPHGTIRNIELLSGFWMMITELPQQIYSGIPILFNLLTLVVILRSVYLWYQVGVTG